RPEPEGDDVEHRDQAHEAETGDPGGAASEPGRQGGHGVPLQVSAQRQTERGGGCEDDGGDDTGRHTKEVVGAGTEYELVILPRPGPYARMKSAQPRCSAD